MIKPRGQTILIIQLRVSPKNIKGSVFQHWEWPTEKSRRINRRQSTAPGLRPNRQNPFGGRCIIAFYPFVTKVKMPAVFDNRRADAAVKLSALLSGNSADAE